MKTKDILQAAIERGASDIHIVVDCPPILRIDGGLQRLGEAVLTPEETRAFVKDITLEHHREQLDAQGGADFSYEMEDGHLFRVSILMQSKKCGAVLRLIPDTTLCLEDIGLPQQVRDILMKPRGLILMTGPTGSGKSTTLSAMIDYINQRRECNIITAEDPIEYRHTHKKSIIIQREVGEDVPSFEDALIRALRQDPDVILVGEMRNLETISAAIRAAETGHLVMSTLHTTGAARTVDRIVDVFPANHRDEIRTQLAGNILCVISQQLVPRKDGKGRVAAFEVMFNTPSIAAYIRENKTFQITSDLQTGSKYGMCTMDSCLLKLYLENEISYTEMMSRCYDKELINKLLNDYAQKEKLKK
jgi:twitching motility protein PilT